MIVFLDDAIPASNNSKSGKGEIPWMDRGDFKSSAEVAISISLIHNMASGGHFEQEHNSVLNLIFQHANVS